MVIGKHIKIFMRISCALILLGIIFSRVRRFDLGDFKTLGYLSAFIAAAIMNVAQSSLCTYRWRLIQDFFSKPPPFVISFWAYLECGFYNQALPSFIGGDTVRILRWCESGITAAYATASVVFDRVFGALGAAILAILACFMLRDTAVESYKVLSAFILAGGILFACAAFLLIVRLPATHKWFLHVHRLHAFSVAVSGWTPSAFSVVFFVVLGFVGQIIAGLAVYTLSRGLGIELSLPVLVSVTGIILLLSMVPISFAGWGVREAAFVTLLVPLGISNSSALALGISFGLSTLVGSLPGGISALLDFASPSRHSLLLQKHISGEDIAERSKASQ